MPPPPEAPVRLPEQTLLVHIEKRPAAEAGGRLPLPPEIQRQTTLNLDAPPPPALPRRPLFSQQTARGLPGAAVMREVAGGAPDVHGLIRHIVACRPLRRLPRMPRPSARAGCQLPLDFSEALAPWWEDMRGLLGQFHDLLGEDACPVYEFAGNPQEASRWTESGERPWRAVACQPVAVATDFGQIRFPGSGPRPGLAVWRKFAAHCRRQQVPPIALTPLRRERCPQALGHSMAIIHWNPATRAADIKRLIERPRLSRDGAPSPSLARESQRPSWGLAFR